MELQSVKCTRRSIQVKIAALAIGLGTFSGISGASEQSAVSNFTLTDPRSSGHSFSVIDITLDILIKILSELLASPVEQAGLVLVNLDPLEQTAEALNTDYSLYGIDQNLPSSKVEDGILSGHQLLDHLKDYGSELNLSSQSQSELQTTVSSMIQELETYE